MLSLPGVIQPAVGTLAESQISLNLGPSKFATTSGHHGSNVHCAASALLVLPLLLSCEAFAAFREGGQIVCALETIRALQVDDLSTLHVSGWGDPDAGGQPSGLGTSLGSGVVKVCGSDSQASASPPAPLYFYW